MLRSFVTGFVTLFATVIAITKDLPDIEGDKQFGIETFATRMGVRCAVGQRRFGAGWVGLGLEALGLRLCLEVIHWRQLESASPESHTTSHPPSTLPPSHAILHSRACPRRNISFLGSGLLLVNYGVAIALALRLPALFNPLTMGLGHAVLAAVLIYKTLKLDAAGYSPQAIKDYYAAIW